MEEIPASSKKALAHYKRSWNTKTNGVTKFHVCVTLAEPRGSQTRESEGVEKTRCLLVDEDYLLGKGSLPLCGAGGFNRPRFVEYVGSSSIGSHRVFSSLHE